MSMIGEVLIPTVLAPALATGLVGLLWRPWTRSESGPQSFVPSLALVAGYIAGYAALLSWPPLPPQEAAQWHFYFLLLAAVVGFGTLRLNPWQRVFVATFAGGLLLGLFLLPFWRYNWTPLVSALVLVGGLLLLVVLARGSERLLRLEPRLQRASVSMWLLAAAATAPLVGSARLGFLAGAALASLLTLEALTRLVRRTSLPFPATLLVVLLPASLVTQTILYVQMPWSLVTLLILVPLPLWWCGLAPASLAGEAPQPRNMRLWLALTALVLVLLATIGLALFLWLQAPQIDPYDY